MRLLFSKKEKMTITLILMVLLLVILTAQFYFLSPLKSEYQTKEQTLNSEQKLLSDLEQQVANNSNQNENEDTTELQRQIPVKPLQDQFILDLQHAETVSNSQIKSMSFTNGRQSGASTNDQNGLSNSTANGATGSTANNTSSLQPSNSTAFGNQSSGNSGSTVPGQQPQNTTSTGSSQQSKSNPALSKLTVQLSVESPNYDDFEKFINTIESLKRIAVVENINYTGPAEITSLTLDTQPFTYTLTVSAYYMPSLTDLQSQLPKVDYPAPADKTNPLANYPDLTP